MRLDKTYIDYINRWSRHGDKCIIKSNTRTSAGLRLAPSCALLSALLVLPRGGRRGTRGIIPDTCSDLGKETFLFGGSGGGGGGIAGTLTGVACSKFTSEGVDHCIPQSGKLGHGSVLVIEQLMNT